MASAAGAGPAHASTGVVLFAGSVAHSMTGRGAPAAGFDGVEATSLSRFHRIAALEKVPITSIIAGPTAAHFCAIDASGSLWVWGRNERGQLGTGAYKNIYNPVAAAGLSEVVTAAVGRSHSLVATRDGSVYGAGENKSGQLGLGKAAPAPATTWSKVKTFLPAGRTIVALAAGGDFSLALDSAGSVWAAGSEEFGQCGTGSTGERIVSAGRLGYDSLDAFELVAALAGERVIAIAAGTNHAAALTEDGQVYSWGCGGYGRLGHGGAADELSPKRIKAFEPERMRVRSISAGATCLYFVTRLGSMIYMAGVTKKSGEANTTPKPVYDLQGFIVRSVGCGQTSTVVAADDAVVTWGPSPAYGELGYGEDPRSSTKAKFVDDLAGMHAIAVAAGMHSSLVLLDATSETPEGAKARAAIAAGHIGLYEPKEPAGGAGAAPPPADADAPAAAAAGSKRKAGGSAAASSSSRGGKGASAGTKKR